MPLFEIDVQYEGEQGLYDRKLGFISGTPVILKFEIDATTEEWAMKILKCWLLDQPPSFRFDKITSPITLLR